jgi:hypothetical protein
VSLGPFLGSLLGKNQESAEVAKYHPVFERHRGKAKHILPTSSRAHHNSEPKKDQPQGLTKADLDLESTCGQPAVSDYDASSTTFNHGSKAWCEDMDVDEEIWNLYGNSGKTQATSTARAVDLDGPMNIIRNEALFEENSHLAEKQNSSSLKGVDSIVHVELLPGS